MNNDDLEWRQFYARQKRIDHMLFALCVACCAAVAILLSGCASTGQGQDLHLAGNGGALFRKLTGANAITVSESTTIYGVDTPSNPQLVCHESRHKLQAKVIADALVLIGAIDDDEPSRMAAWISVYSIEHLQRGYAGNRYEIEARNVCKDVR
ncbi:MAG: hypothetical protein NW202_13555 [Nitrospira sp.]|nr:hypothetical protein [Nitrospira sp.]